MKSIVAIHILFVLPVLISSLSAGNILDSSEDKMKLDSIYKVDDNCFPGAYYRKIVSPVDNWIGIEGSLILPEVFLDDTRVKTSRLGCFLDNSSVYLGGRADGQETDLGLAWEVIRDESGNISKERKAFRPFLRRASHPQSGQKSLFSNAPAIGLYYWYPGDTIHMRLEVISDGRIKFTVTGAGKHFEEIFEANGYKLSEKAEYKRVNAIDQAGNEGRPVQPTQAKVIGAKWLKTSFLRMCGSKVEEIPMEDIQYMDIRCPDSYYFDIRTENAIEIIDIYGTK